MADLSKIRKNGVDYDIKDATARAEIEELKRNGTATETISKTGEVVSIDADEGTEIAVEADTTEEVTLVHQGKNLLKGVNTVTSSNVTATLNEDGTYHFSGTAKEDLNATCQIVPTTAKLYLPAGTYLVSCFFPNENFVQIYIKNSVTNEGITLANPKTTGKMVITTGGMFHAVMQIAKGTTVDDDAWIQVELYDGADEWTAFEKPVRKEFTTTLPAKVEAFDGKNILYTTTGDVLTVRTQKSESVDEKIAEALKFDATVYDIPILTLDGDCAGMTKDDYVPLKYTFQGMSGTADVKKQGTSSISTGTSIGSAFDTDVGGLFNFTIKFPGEFEAKDGWGAHKKYVFKADAIDHSHIRNVGGAKLWGQIVATRTNINETLAASPNYGAIDGFPCAIVLNGKFYALGMFNIPKDDWMMNMGSGTQEALLCAAGSTNCFMKQEVTVAAEGADFDLEYVTDEDNADWVQTSLNTMVNALLNTDATDLDTTVAQYIDWESAIDLMIFIQLIGGFDLRQKNYTLATYDGVKWIFGAYDMDSIWGNWWDGASFIPANTPRTNITNVCNHRAFRLIRDYKLDAYKARYAELREGVMSEVNVETTLANLSAGIPVALLNENVKRWPLLRSTSVNNLHQILNWYRMRCQIVDKEVESL